MFKSKKGVTAVVATALLITFAVVTVIGFQNWNNNFNSKLLVKAELQSKNSNSLEIEQIVEDYLYLKNTGDTNLSIQTIKLGSYDCQINQNLEPGITRISLNSCLLSTPNNNIKEVTVISSNQVQSKSFYVDTSNLFVRPTLEFTASKTSLDWSEPVLLNWTSTGSDNCSALGDWTGIKALSDTQLLLGLTSSKVYTLTCQNLAYSITKSITINVGNQDITPNDFSFTNLTSQNINTTIYSDIVTIAGFSGNITGTIAGDGSPEFQQNDGIWTTNLNNFSSGNTLRLRLNTTLNYNQIHLVSLTLGDYNIDWSVQTKVQDITPDIISFNDLFGQELNSNISSNVVTLTGFDGPVVAQITGTGFPQLKINSNEFTNSSQLIYPGDSIQLQLTTDNTIQKDFNTTISIGNLNFKWNVQSKNLNYNWNSTSWSICDNSCGSGSQTRTVWCERADGQTVADVNCIGPKPSTSQSCSDYSTCTFSWLTGSFSSCSSTCGSGSQSRTVECERSEGTIVGDANCLAVKPALSQSCSDYSSCTYQWISESWNSCSNTCGSGTHSRNVYCERSDGTTVGDINCLAAKPITSESCSDYSTCSYDWLVGSWSTCTLTVSGGTQTRSVQCQRNPIGDIVGDVNCLTVKPSISQSCNYFGDGSDGSVTLSVNTEFANNDGNFIVKQFDNLVINNGVVVKPSEPTYGMFIFVKGDCTINGELSVSLMGKGGDDGTDLLITDLTDFADYTGDLLNYKVPAYGGVGASGISGSSLIGLTGTNGVNGGTGGGGSGGRNGHNVNCPTTFSGSGAQGTSRSGGAGGGGSAADDCGGARSGTNALITGVGGNGGNSAHGHGGGGGGGGNAPGTGGLGSYYYGTGLPGNPGETGLGGVLWLVVEGNLILGPTGKITAKGPDGGRGGTGTSAYHGAGGGGGGGGSIHVFYGNSVTNNGIIQAPGGLGGPYYASSHPGHGYQGGSGGSGSVVGPIKIDP